MYKKKNHDVSRNNFVKECKQISLILNVIKTLEYNQK